MEHLKRTIGKWMVSYFLFRFWRNCNAV